MASSFKPEKPNKSKPPESRRTVRFVEKRAALEAKEKAEVEVSENSEESELEEEVEEEVRRGPPVKSKKGKEPAAVKEKALPKAVIKPAELPYVDVPPRKILQRPVGTPAPGVEDAAVRAVPAYRTQAPVEETTDPAEILGGIMELSVTIPLGHLLGSSPLVRDAVRKNLTKTRKPVLLEEVIDEVYQIREIETGLTVDQLPISNFMLAGLLNDHRLDPEYKVASDPYLQFAQANNGAVPKEVYVARDTYALRSVYPQINGLGPEESILDSGSQIVSMSEATAVGMGLTWNPNITINMQSANGNVERSLGLAENVPFTFGTVTVYLQVHIIRHPAYRVLLGRPFDVLTSSEIKNSSDGDMRLIVNDPNSDRRVVLPTYRRGESPGQQAQSF